jgi:hypothetical protein
MGGVLAIKGPTIYAAARPLVLSRDTSSLGSSAAIPESSGKRKRSVL